MPAPRGPRSDAVARVVPRSFAIPDPIHRNFSYDVRWGDLAVVERWGVPLLRSTSEQRSTPGSKLHWSPPIEEALPAFARLADATDDQVVEFAKRWGVLEICEHLVPRHGGCESVQDAATPADPGWLEPIDTWRRLARHLQAVRILTAQLQSGGFESGSGEWELLRWGCPDFSGMDRRQLPTPGELAFAQHASEPPPGMPADWWRRPGPDGHPGHIGLAGRPSSAAEGWLRLEGVAEYWMRAAEIRIDVVRAGGADDEEQTRLVPLLACGSLSGALAVGLVAAAAGDLYLCDECHCAYEIPEGGRRPWSRGGRQQLCPDCRAGDYRLSKIRSRQRRRQARGGQQTGTA